MDMSEETKYYCDECGVDITHRDSVTLVVLCYQGHGPMPNKWRLEKYNKIPYIYKEVYNRMLCPDCVGAKIQWKQHLEPHFDFSLKEKARAFLIKHGLLRNANETDESDKSISKTNLNDTR